MPSTAGVTLTSTAKSETIKGTSRDDLLDGAPGNDQIKAGDGGGNGVDTVRLNFAASEWAGNAGRADVTRFVAFLALAPQAALLGAAREDVTIIAGNPLSVSEVTQTWSVQGAAAAET